MATVYISDRQIRLGVIRVKQFERLHRLWRKYHEDGNLKGMSRTMEIEDKLRINCSFTYQTLMTAWEMCDDCSI